MKRPLGEICRFVNGKAFTDTDWSSSGYPIIRIQNLNDHKKPFNYWNGSLDRQILVKKGNLLLAWSGTPGTSFGAHIWNRQDGVLNQHIFKVEVEETRASIEYLLHAINFGLKGLICSAQGAVGLRHVTKNQVESLEIPLPDLPTQRRIAAKLKAQLGEIEQARQAAEEQLRTAGDIQDRFAFETLETGNQWPRKPLEELCDIESGQVDPKLPQFACLPHVNGGNIVSGRSRLASVRTAAEDGMTSGKYLFRRGQVLYSKLRPYLRKAVLAEFDGVCSADMYPITPRASLLDARYLCQLLISAPFTAYAAEQSERARMPKLNREQLLAWKAPVPDLSTQKKLSARLAAIEEEAHNLESAVREKLAALQKLPAAFLREAFGGIS